MNTLSTRLQSWTTWVVETLYLTHGKSDPKDRSIRRNSARSRRWSVGSKNSLIIILGEIIYLVHLRIRVCLGTTWPRHDNESLVYVMVKLSYNSLRIYLATGLCKRCAARITRDPFIFYASFPLPYVSFVPPPITRSRDRLLVLPLLSIPPFCPSLRILLSC